MTTSNRLLNFLLVLLMTTTLLSCGVETSSLPPERPIGQVTGNAIDSAISNATVSVYSFANGVRGERLGSGTTDGAGAFSVDVQAESQLVMVEVTGGTYVEEASGVEVPIAEGQKLRSLVQYESGETVSTNVTPLTHMATALAEYKIANGTGSVQATKEAFDVINQFFKVNSRDTISVNIAADSTVETLNEEARYGFYLAGISHWTAWASRKSGLAPHTNYTSIALANVLYNDIRFDGLMDGTGSDGDNNAEPKMFASVPLDADEYRLMFTVHAIALGMGQNNKTQINVDDQAIRNQLEEIANTTGDQSSLLPQDTEAVNIGNLPMTVSVAASEYSGIYGQQYNFTIQVESLVGADRILVYLDQNPEVVPSEELIIVDDIGSTEAPVAQLDISAGVTSGNHMIYVVATDIFGGGALTSFEVTFDTEMPSVSFDQSPYLTDSTDATVTGTFSDNLAGVQTIMVENVEAVLTYVASNNTTSGQWTADLQGLAPGANQLTVSITDYAGNTTVLQNIATVYLDDQSPIITSNHSNAFFSGENGPVSQPLNDINPMATPLYIETNKIQGYDGPDTAEALEAAGIPFFRFTVSDMRAQPDIYTDTSQLAASVSIKYAKTDANMNVIFPDHDNVAKNPMCNNQTNTCEYLVPLTHPFLPTDWDQATPTDEHVIEVRVVDGAGNEEFVQFKFFADYVVPQIPICGGSQCGTEELAVSDLDPFTIYTGPNFDNREDLYNKLLETTEYSFRNPSDRSIYIKIDPNGASHEVSQIVEEERSFQLVNKSTTIQWQRVRLTQQKDANGCPIPETVGNTSELHWRDTQAILNYNNMKAWEIKNVTDSEFSKGDVQEKARTTDLSLLPPYSNWEDIHFDSYFSPDPNDPNLLVDYSTSTNGFFSYAFNVQLNQVCAHYFQQRDVYSYSAIGTPGEDRIDLPPIFSTLASESFVVFLNGNTVEPVQPVANGWFLIDAGSDVTIIRKVNTLSTPATTFYKDDFNANVAPFEQPGLRRDKSFTWSIDRDLTILTIHDTGVDNIELMSARNTVSATGVKSYTIERQ